LPAEVAPYGLVNTQALDSDSLFTPVVIIIIAIVLIACVALYIYVIEPNFIDGISKRKLRK